MKRIIVISIGIIFSLSGAQIKKADAPLWQAIKNREYQKVKRLVAEGTPYRDVVKTLVQECKAEEEKILTCPVPSMKVEEITHALQAITQGAQTAQVWKLMRNNNVTEIRKLFAQNKVGDLTIRHKGQTLLHWAARHGYLDIAEQCIKRAIPVDVADDEGITPLLRAVQYGNIKMVQLLLAQGADINTQDHDGLTALMWAVYHGYEALSKWFIDKGANLQLRNVCGMTALAMAVEFEKYTIAQLLLRHGADLAELTPEMRKAFTQSQRQQARKSKACALVPIEEEKIEEEKKKEIIW